jgi:MOSC domain-containing protein YiiM
LSASLVSVNVGRARVELLSGRELATAIVKAPADGRVAVGVFGLEGDEVADTMSHGGRDQALYLYTVEDYSWWSRELGRDLLPGTFGENLTVAGLESAALAIGDTLHMGETELQVTAPRIPCSTFAARMGEPQWVKRFAAAGRPGAYLRVLRPGTVAAGDPVEVKRAGCHTLPLLELQRLHYDRKAPAAELERALQAPLAERARVDLERRLAR